MSSSIGEHELNAKNMAVVKEMAQKERITNAKFLLDVKDVVGDYAAWNYFQKLPGERNRMFVESFQRKFGKDRVTDDPIEAGYLGIYLWAQAVEDAQSIRPADILKALRRQSFNAPEGVVYIDPENLHAWKSVRIGQIQADGQFKIVWDSEKPIRPVP